MTSGASGEESWRVARTETARGKVLLVEHAMQEDLCFGDRRVELTEARQVLHCTTSPRVYEEVVLSVVRTCRDQVVSAMLRREQAEVDTGTAGRTAES